MGRGRLTGVARIAQQIAALDVAAALDGDFVEVAEDGRKAVIVYQLDHIAEAGVAVQGGPLDHAVGGGANGRTALGAQVDAAVQAFLFVDRMLAHAVTAGDQARVDRKAAGNGAQHQLPLVRGAPGNVEPLGQGLLVVRLQAHQRFDPAQLAAEGGQFAPAFPKLVLQSAGFGRQALVVGLNALIVTAQAGNLPIEFAHPAGQQDDGQCAADERNCQPGRRSGDEALCPLAKREMLRTAMAGNCD